MQAAKFKISQPACRAFFRHFRFLRHFIRYQKVVLELQSVVRHAILTLQAGLSEFDFDPLMFCQTVRCEAAAGAGDAVGGYDCPGPAGLL